MFIEAERDMDDLSEFSTPDETSALDCARFVAEKMLRSALARDAKSLPHGLFLIVAPADAWHSSLRLAILDIYLGGRKRRRNGSGHSRIHFSELSGRADSKVAGRIIAEIQEELADGKTSFLMTSDLHIVPLSLRRASDRIIHVPSPRRLWLAALIREIAPMTRRIDFAGLACETVGPADLRLAYRFGTSAKNFLQRLRILMEPAPGPFGGKSVSINKLHGVDEAKLWSTALKADLLLYGKGQITWQELPRGLLLSGPPGTGKTTLAHAIAADCGLNFISTSYAEWQRHGSGHLGDVLRAMAAVFAEARLKKPALLFIDELDTVGSRGQSEKNDDWWRAIINALLESLDGTIDNEGIIFVGATNFADRIDSAILRSGRIEDHIVLKLPGSGALASIYRDQLASVLSGPVDWEILGRMSVGINGADAVKNCVSARRRARNDHRSVRFEDVLSSILGDAAEIDIKKNLRCAVHEAGHAILAVHFQELSLEHVSIVTQGDSGGGAFFGPKVAKLMTPMILNAYLTAILAGRAAEEILEGEISAGAGGAEGCDLSLATLIAASAELSFGFRKEGLIWYPQLPAAKLIKLFAQRPDIEKTIQKRLDSCYASALELIKSKAPLVRRLANQLLISKVLTGEQVSDLVSNSVGEYSKLSQIPAMEIQRSIF